MKRRAVMREAKAARIFLLSLCVGLACLRGVLMAGQANTTPPAAPVTNGATTTDEGWQKEFDAICSKTQDAMSYSQEELTSLIQKCDTLMPQIEKLDETRKKVYLKRLRTCRGLYAYVLESRKNEKK